MQVLHGCPEYLMHAILRLKKQKPPPAKAKRSAIQAGLAVQASFLKKTAKIVVTDIALRMPVIALPYL